MIIASKLEKELSTEGFQLAYEDTDTMEFVLVRCGDNELFERIRVIHGNGGATVSVGVEVSIVPGRTALKGLCIHRCLVELATDQTTGWTTLKDEQCIRTFKDRIRLVAPEACCELADEVGGQLLENTASARMAAKKYLEILRRLGPDELLERVSPDGPAEVDRIIRQGIVRIPEGRAFYETAIQVIASCCGEVEGEQDWLRGRNADTTSNRQLMIRLQIMASRLADEQGW